MRLANTKILTFLKFLLHCHVSAGNVKYWSVAYISWASGLSLKADVFRYYIFRFYKMHLLWMHMSYKRYWTASYSNSFLSESFFRQQTQSRDTLFNVEDNSVCLHVHFSDGFHELMMTHNAWNLPYDKNKYISSYLHCHNQTVNTCILNHRVTLKYKMSFKNINKRKTGYVIANRVFICVNSIHYPFVNSELMHTVVTLRIRRNGVLYMQYVCQKLIKFNNWFFFT